MPQVSIGSNLFTTYADVDEGNLYLSAAFHADAWRALDDDDTKARALVTATRILDRQKWRTNYQTFAERLEVEAIVNASIELANYIVDGVDVQNDQNISQKIQELQAGSVSISYFRGAEGASLRFPLIVTELLKDYLMIGTNAVSGVASGVDGESITNNDYGYTEGI